MTNTIPNVPRELLERAATSIERRMCLQCEGVPCCMPESLNTLSDIRALLSAPSPAGVEGLEVVQAVAWLNTATKEATTHPVVVMDWDDEKEPVESLMPISQHEAIIDGLRGENERIRLNIAEYNEAIACYQSERDQQAQRIGELERALLEVAASLAWNAHGECRAIHDGPIMPSKMALDAAKAALSAGKEGE